MNAVDLERLDALAAERDSLQNRLRAIRSASVVSATNYSQTGTGSGTGDPVASAVVSAAEVEDDIVRIVLEMVEIIDTIPPMKTRKIFRRRYINRFAWAQIADEMGYISVDGPKKRMRGYKKGLFVPSRTPLNGVK